MRLVKIFARFFSPLLWAVVVFAPPAYALEVDGEVNLYTDRQEVFLRPLTAEFTRQFNIPVKVLFVKKGLLERMRAEGGESPADVILAADIGRLFDFVDAGLTQETADDAFAVIPKVYRDDNRHWFGVTRRARILYTAKNSGAGDYDDLAQANLPGGICSRNGLHPYNIALFADIIHRKGEAAAAQWLRAVKNNLARTPRGNDRTQIRAVLKKECAVAVANSYYYFHLLAQSDDQTRRELQQNIRVVFPPSPHFNITGMARAKNSPNKNAAVLLMKFLISARAQTIYAAQNFEFPILPPRDDIVLPPPLSLYKKMLDDNPPPIKHIAQLRRRASELVESVNYNR